MRSLLALFLFSPLLGCADDKAAGDTSGGDDTGDTTDTGGADCVEENGACILEGIYTESMTLTADKAWLLRGPVSIGDDSAAVTLTIEAGTTVYGESASNGFLVITRGAKIEAVGTASAPIVFTSDQPAGSRARGDWGGLALNGRAPINACADTTTVCEAEGEGGTGTYGGDDPTDSSGTLSYVVIQFGGTEISPDNEINGLGLQGVGSGTSIDHVQIHKNFDDGIEFWGGTVSVKHLVVTGAGDDGIDWDLGWQGNIQFAVVQQGTDLGNHGWETDSNEDDHTRTPVSSPTISNVTVLGAEAIAEDNFGIVLRRGSSPDLHNIAVAGFSAGCLAIRDQATFDAFASGAASIQHSALACSEAFEESEEETETGTEDEVFEGGTGNVELDDLGLTDAWNLTAPNFQPESGSSLLGAGAAPGDNWFDSADYIGAFDGSDDWTAGWTEFPAN